MNFCPLIGLQSFHFKLSQSQRLPSFVNTSSVKARGLALPHAIAAVCADSGRAFFLRTAAEINVIANPTGNGSMNVYNTL